MAEQFKQFYSVKRCHLRYKQKCELIHEIYFWLTRWRVISSRMHPREVFCPFHTFSCIFAFTNRINRRFRALYSFSSPNILFIQQPFNRKVNRQPWSAGWICRTVAILVWFGYKRFNAERYTSSRGRPSFFHGFVNESQFGILAQKASSLASGPWNA